MAKPSIAIDLKYFFLIPGHAFADEIRTELCRKHAETWPDNVCSITESRLGAPIELLKVDGADQAWFDGFFTAQRQGALSRIPANRTTHSVFVRDEFYTPTWSDRSHFKIELEIRNHHGTLYGFLVLNFSVYAYQFFFE